MHGSFHAACSYVLHSPAKHVVLIWTCCEVLNLNTTNICKFKRVQAPCSLRDAVLQTVYIPCQALHGHSDWSKRTYTV